MAKPQMFATTMRHIRVLAGSSKDSATTDRDLLARYVIHQDEGAFAALMNRHGGMVLGLARRVLENTQDAEDVFQAAFLLLARKAGSLRKWDSVGSWLYSVVYRLALRARRQRAGRLRREQQAAIMQTRKLDAQSAWHDLEKMLDEVLQQLPERYKQPLILCCIEGRSHEEAARELGCPIATLRSRLARGRERLRLLLGRRGAMLSIGALATFLAAEVPATAVATSLRRSTLEAALRFASGKAASHLVSRPVATLVDGALRASIVTHMKLVVAIFLALGLVTTSALAISKHVFAVHSDVEDQEAEATGQDGIEPPASETNPVARTDRYGDPLPLHVVTRLGTIRFRHGREIRSIAFSPDGKSIASGGGDCAIRIWRRDSGREAQILAGHGETVRFVLYTPDGKHLISSSGDGFDFREASIRMWDLDSGREVRRFPANPWARGMDALALSPDGKTLAAGSNSKIWLYDVATGATLRECTLETGIVWRLAFSSDARKLAVVADYFGVGLLDATTGNLDWRNEDQKRTDNILDDRAPGLAFTPDGQKLCVNVLSDKPMRLLDAASGKEIRRTADGGRTYGNILFSRSGKRLFSFMGCGIIRDAATLDQVGKFDSSPSQRSCLALSPDGKTLAVAHKQIIRFWDAETGEEIGSPEGGLALIDSLAVSADGKKVVTASLFDQERSLRVWDVAAARQQCGLGTSINSCCTVAIAPDGNTFATDFDNKVTIAETASCREVRVMKGGPRSLNSMAFTPDGKTLLGAIWIGGPIWMWDVQSGNELPPLGNLAPLSATKSLATSPDGKYAATGGRDGVIRLWDIAARKEVRQFTGQKGAVWSVAISPDGKMIAGVTPPEKLNFFNDSKDPSIRIWDVNSGRLLKTLPGSSSGNWSVAWSPDSRVLASGGDDCTISLWEAATGDLRKRLLGHLGPVTALAFTRDGKLVSGSSDTTVLVWDIAAVDLPSVRPNARELPRLLRDLGSPNAAEGFRALQSLSTVPELSIPMLKTCLQPASVANAQQLARLIENLNAESFAAREQATRELMALDFRARPALVRALEDHPTPEVRRRIEPLLEALDRPNWPDELREIRAVEVLERIGSRNAKELLSHLAKGDPNARQTEHAKAALHRLESNP